MTNGKFTTKYFYTFLNHGLCPRKAKLFKWLAWGNHILTLENLVARKCNQQPTSVLCQVPAKSRDHLFLLGTIAECLWNFVTQLFRIPNPLASCTSCGVLGDPDSIILLGTLEIYLLEL